MLSAFFDIRQPAASSKQHQPAASSKQQQPAAAKKSSSERRRKGGHGSRLGKCGAAAPMPTEASTTQQHAKFVALPPEANAPKPAEVGGAQTWHALNDKDEKDDDFSEFRPGWDEDDDQAGQWEEAGEDLMDDISEPDFEPESLDLLAPQAEGGKPGSVSGSSVEDSTLDSFDVRSFFMGRKTKYAHEASPVYSGPRLCCEDDEFDD